MENQFENENLVRGVTYDDEPEKIYLILIDGESRNDDNSGEQYRDWEIVEGRQAAYDYIKGILESEYVIVDIKKSKIIVSSDKVKITDGISIYHFMKKMKDSDKVIDYTSFDIEDYLSYESDSEGEE